MAKFWSEVQVGVRQNARDDSIDLSVDPGLARANSIYRKLAVAIPWSELRVTTSSAEVTAATGTYDWPTTSIFIDVVSMEIRSSSTASRNLLISPASENDWNLAAKQVNTVPVYYVRKTASSGTDSVELRPIPSYDVTEGIQITGYIEPTEYDGSTPAANPTVFLQKTADDVLELLIAADWLSQQGSEQFAVFQIQQATQILQRMFGKELVPAELVSSIAGVPTGGGGRG